MKGLCMIVLLDHRRVIQLKGKDRFQFLQGLVTQDLLNFQEGEIRYSLLLSPQGRFQYDLFFMVPHDDPHTLWIDTDQEEALIKRLSQFILRKEVMIEKTDYHVFAQTFGDAPKEGNLFKDPRHKQMGYRLYSKKMPDKTDPLEAYDRLRSAFAIPDGIRDMEGDRSLPLEWNMDHLHALSFTKGCFMGQELTARTKHRQLIKKRLQSFYKTLPEGLEPLLVYHDYIWSMVPVDQTHLD